jgi:membrane complex biogenesis BtpA family protein
MALVHDPPNDESRPCLVGPDPSLEHAMTTTHPHRWLDARPILLGVVHLAPLPGSPRWQPGSMPKVIASAVRDAERLLEAGLDGFVVENFGDNPFHKGPVPAHTIAAMTAVSLALPRTDAIVGINVLRNDAAGALAIASATDADFIRVNVHVGAMVTDQGLIEGQAANTMRLRYHLGSNVAVLADVAVKHAQPLATGFDLRESAKETVGRGLADALIVTGSATGAPVNTETLTDVAAAANDHPVFVGSGVTANTIGPLLTDAHGVIVGTATKENGDVHAPVSVARTREIVQAAGRQTL